MRPFHGISISALVLSLAASVSLAQPKATRNAGDIAMKSVKGLNQQGTGGVVIGGRPARSDQWPASFYSSAAGGRCTATLVGPRALLLAAHCVGNGKSATIEISAKSVSGRCTHATEWKDGAGDDSADYALCKLNQEVSDILFETVDLNLGRIQKQKDILLTGYGCTVPPVGGGDPSGGNDGIYRIGESPVVALPGEIANEANTILTRDKEKMICPGDSGGGAYVILSEVTDRILVGINSRVRFEKGESYLSSLGSTTGKAFLNKWVADNNGEKICGVNLKGKTCR